MRAYVHDFHWNPWRIREYAVQVRQRWDFAVQVKCAQLPKFKIRFVGCWWYIDIRLTFWITRQPYICKESRKILPSITVVRTLLCRDVPYSIIFWITWEKITLNMTRRSNDITDVVAKNILNKRQRVSCHDFVKDSLSFLRARGF